MRTIYKYPVLPGLSVIQMPAGAKILSAHVQYDTLMLWALVNADAATELRELAVFGTGDSIRGNQDLEFIGTVLLHDGTLVLHVFEVLGHNC